LSHLHLGLQDIGLVGLAHVEQLLRGGQRILGELN
jgi:hypothetical protein